MPAIYTPPAFQRYLGFTADPNSAAGGSNLETILADNANFPSGVIPDVTSPMPVTTGDHQFTPSRISRANEVTSQRAGRADIPFKVSPVLPFGVNAYRWTLEKALKYVMGAEAAGPGPASPGAAAVGTGGTFAAGTYFWKVTAIMPWGESSPSTEVTATLILNGSATITWSAVTGATGYNIYRSTTTGTEGTSPAFVTKVGAVVTYTDTGTAVSAGAAPGPNTHVLSALGLGSTQLPSALIQLIRDSVNIKNAGCTLESVDVTFPFDGPGTINVEAHPLYSTLVTTAQPTGVAIEPAALPMVVRDALVYFDGGATTQISVSQFSFGFKNNSSYDRQIAGHCIDTKTVGATPIARQLWFPHYHKISARQTVTWGLNFLDTQQAQEVAAEWGQIQKIQVIVAEPNVPGNQATFTLYATEIESGGVDALTATGDQTQSFTGNGFYSQADGTDVNVAITNTSGTAIA